MDPQLLRQLRRSSSVGGGLHLNLVERHLGLVYHSRSSASVARRCAPRARRRPGRLCAARRKSALPARTSEPGRLAPCHDPFQGGQGKGGGGPPPDSGTGEAYNMNEVLTDPPSQADWEQIRPVLWRLLRARGRHGAQGPGRKDRPRGCRDQANPPADRSARAGPQAALEAGLEGAKTPSARRTSVPPAPEMRQALVPSDTALNDLYPKSFRTNLERAVWMDVRDSRALLAGPDRPGSRNSAISAGGRSRGCPDRRGGPGTASLRSRCDRAPEAGRRPISWRALAAEEGAAAAQQLPQLLRHNAADSSSGSTCWTT